MSLMFHRCSSLLSLPDISKWDTNNVKYMGGKFYGCLNTIFSKSIKSKFNEAL